MRFVQAMFSIRSRIMLVLSFQALVLILGIYCLQRIHTIYINSIKMNLNRESVQLIYHSLDTRFTSLINTVDGYLQDNQIEQSMVTGQYALGVGRWRHLMEDYHLSSLWLLNDKCIPVHHWGMSSMNYPLRGASPLRLKDKFANSESCFFFTNNNGRIQEIIEKRITFSNSHEYFGAKPLYLLMTRRCDDRYLNELAHYTSRSMIMSLQPSPPLSLLTKFSGGNNKIELPLKSWDGKAVGAINIINDEALFKNYFTFIHLAFLFSVIGCILLLSAGLYFLIIWFYIPMNKIAKCQDNPSIRKIDSLAKSGNEMGHIAKMLMENIEKRVELEKEVEIRSSMEAKLKSIQEELEARVMERTSELTVSHEMLEAKIKEHEEAERSIRVLYMQQERRLRHMDVLRKLDSAIASQKELRLILDTVLDEIINQLRVDAAGIMKLDDDDKALRYVASKGFRYENTNQLIVPYGEGHSGRAAKERRTIQVPFLTLDPNSSFQLPIIEKERFVSYFAVPIIARDKVYGVVTVFTREPLDVASEWIDYLQTLAGQTAIAMDSAAMFEELKQANRELTEAYDATIEGWSKALEFRDRETGGHSQRVTDMTIKIAEAMGMSIEEIAHLSRGAMLHDIGKMGIPDNILLKPGKLTDEEWIIMRTHPQIAYDLLAPIKFLERSLDIPYSHHEKWDGTGYPQGLKEEEIPLGARIFAVADVWDALRSDRPYKKAFPFEKALECIREGSGSHFDPAVIEIFFELFEKEVEKLAA